MCLVSCVSFAGVGKGWHLRDIDSVSIEEILLLAPVVGILQSFSKSSYEGKRCLSSISCTCVITTVELAY